MLQAIDHHDNQISIEFNQNLLVHSPNLKQWINEKMIASSSYAENLKQLQFLDHGGFNHGDLSGRYSVFQNDARYGETRLSGWRNLFALLMEKTPLSEMGQQGLILDFLSGSGTLSKRAKQIWISESPQVMGIDISFEMCKQAYKNKESVFWGSHDLHPFRLNCADACVAAYGLHHVPSADRNDFISSMARTLNDRGACLIHDFEEGSASAKFYSELIHNYRVGGHDYDHFTSEEFYSLLNASFYEVETYRIYDPFYLEGKSGQSAESLKHEFLFYLVNLFNLTKLLPAGYSYIDLMNNSDGHYWKEIETLISQYLRISPQESDSIVENISCAQLKNFSVPLVNELSLVQLEDGRYTIIGPRAALVGIGYQKRI